LVVGHGRVERLRRRPRVYGALRLSPPLIATPETTEARRDFSGRASRALSRECVGLP
jgi:hypothetical protein